MEKKKNQVKENVATGVSSTVGAAVGVVAGSMVTGTAYASDEVPVENVVTDSHSPGDGPQVTQTVGESQENTGGTSAEVQTGNDTPQVDVLSYDTVSMPDGSLADIAVVNIEGTPVALIDADMDGRADLMASDLNQNGQLENQEVVNIQGENIPMQPLRDVAGVPDDSNNFMAMDDGPDYVNDANVGEYMA